MHSRVSDMGAETAGRCSPKQEDIVARQIVYVLPSLQHDELWEDGHSFQVDGEGPEYLQVCRKAMIIGLQLALASL